MAAVVLPPSAAAQAPAAPELSYVFHFERRPEPRLSIEARFQGGPQGFTVLGGCLSPWPDLPGCGRAVTTVTVRSQRSGKRLPLERPEANIWTCDHAPGEPLVVRYELAPAADASAAPDHAPAVHADYVMFLGDMALLVPEHLVRRPAVRIRYAWDGPLPAGWTAATSFALAAPAKTVRLPVSAFLQSLFFWGAAHLDQATPPGGPPLRVVWLRAAPARAVRESFLSRLLAIRGAVSRYLGRELGPAATCFVLPSAAGRVSAITLTASILLLGDTEALAGAAAGSVKGTLTAAHEFVHIAEAGKIQLVDAPVPANFLTEALAEFIARRALVRAGLIGPEDWAEVVSAKLSEHAAAPVEAASRSGRRPVEPYVLGDLLVIMMDAEIRRVSGGKADVLNLVSELLRRSRREGASARVTWADFRGALSELTSAAFAATVEDVVRQRRRARLSGDMFAGCLRVVEAPLWAFDPGFAAARSIEQRQVSGVREGGAAWKAGLRDGDVLLEWDVQWNRSEVPVRFVIARKGERRAVRYLPRGGAILGSRQGVVPAPGAKGCSGVL
jgi:predicted metalloprotease with PDZ domain